VSAAEDADLIATRVLDLFARAPQTARLRFLRDLIASTGRTLPEALPCVPEPVLTIPRAAQRLGCSDRLVYRLYHRGELAGYSVGSRLLVYTSSVEALIAARSNTKAADPSTTARPASTSDRVSRPTRRNRRSSADPFPDFPPPARRP
jgi:excisionase family DNA binding protein